MRQKFGKLSFVHICKDMPNLMKHFDCDFDAIVNGTYSQIYGGKNIKNYSVYQIKEGRVVNKIAWYDENQLSLLPEQDRDKAEEMIEEYNLSG
jgi:hypothetical protein